ncbi:MAG: hypothetical protein JRI44_08260, partial [Deltaproteobacteria bacterium]|nr:hypothetical protein [Deltaproteobacteria bacterium]
MKKIIFIIFIFTILSFAFQGLLKAATINVPADMDLQAALTFAANNNEDDTINIAAGTYYGNFTYLPGSSEGSLTIIGAGADKTILDGGGNGRVLDIYNSNITWGSNISIKGVTIQNGFSGFTPSTSDKESEAEDSSDENIIKHGNGYYGGGLYVYNYNSEGTGNIVIENCEFKNNHADHYGGGAYAYVNNGNIIFKNNSFIDNSARPYFYYVKANYKTFVGSGNGGGAYAQVVWNGNIIFVNNTFTGNSAWSYLTEKLSPMVKKQTDSIGNGGGVYVKVTYDDIIFTNNSLTLNTAGKGGGVYFEPGYSIDTTHIYNNIIWGNEAEIGSDIYIYFPGYGKSTMGKHSLLPAFPTVNLFNNDFTGIFSSVGIILNQGNNLNVDPLFALPPFDLHLKENSPVIDKGDNNAPEIPALDKDGTPRVQDGDGDGNGVVDMGAYEYPEQYISTPYDAEGLYLGTTKATAKNIKNSGENLYVFIQRYNSGSMMLLYTYDVENFYPFFQINFSGPIFYGKPVHPELKEEVQFDFINKTFTIFREGSAKAHVYQINKLEPVNISNKDGVYKGADSSIDLNVYVQRYKNGGTILIYTFDSKTMVALWDSKVENNIFEGTIINPATLEVA